VNLLLDAAGAALPPSAPWWGGLVAVALTSAAGVVLALIQRRDNSKAEATAKESAAAREENVKLRADLAKALTRIDEQEQRLTSLEDDGTDPEVRVERHQRIEQELAALKAWCSKLQHRAEETAKIDSEIQRAVGRVEGALGRVEGAIVHHADRKR
jgi:DNA repair exonuclease SbcCD ATPase subunit